MKNMKSYNHLFEKIISKNNLILAINNSAKGKANRKDVVFALKNSDQVANSVIEMLSSGNFKIRKHPKKEIYDGISRKKRIIVQPDYLYEQIIHHAIIQVLSPIFIKHIYKYSCGNIPNRGGTYAMKRIKNFIKKYNTEIEYVGKGDIYHFYPSINHEILKKKLAKIFHDPKLLNLLYQIIDSYNTDDNDIGYGLPIGYYTSQWLANFYLLDFDYYIVHEIKLKGYTRYVDDIIFMGFKDSKPKMIDGMKKIEEYLSKELKLKLKDNWQVFLFDDQKELNKKYRKPLDFIGYLFYRDKIIIRKKLMLKATRKAKNIYNKAKNPNSKVTAYDAAQMMSYLSWFKRTNMHKCYKKYIKPYIVEKDLKQIISYKSKIQNNKK